MKRIGRKGILKHWRLRPALNQSGAVTAETALGITSLSTFLVFAIFMISYVSNHLMVTDAARTAARLVARGESEQAVRYAVEILSPESQVFIDYQFDSAIVEVIAPENPKIIWYLPRPRAEVAAYLESSW